VDVKLFVSEVCGLQILNVLVVSSIQSLKLNFSNRMGFKASTSVSLYT
jgi:hypothetical protein